jgi:hypothetical protein
MPVIGSSPSNVRNISRMPLVYDSQPLFSFFEGFSSTTPSILSFVDDIHYSSSFYLIMRSILWVSLYILYVNAISELSIKGNKFFDAEGQQVYFKGNNMDFNRIAHMLGVAYQRSPKDPFENATQCELDADLMKFLGANVIRGTLPPFSMFICSIPC